MSWEIAVFKGSALGGKMYTICAESDCLEQSCVWSEICVWPPETGDKVFHQLLIDPWQLKNTVPMPKAASMLTSEGLSSSFICSNYSYSFFLCFFLNSTV